MMKNIEFRRWNYSHKIMEYSSEMAGGLEQYFASSGGESLSEDMQFTGLIDKNGKKIFEGDIVQSYHFTDTKGHHQFINHIVEWSDKFNGWFMRNEESDDDTGCIQMWVYMRNNKHSAKIISNIHKTRQ